MKDVNGSWVWRLDKCVVQVDDTRERVARFGRLRTVKRVMVAVNEGEINKSYADYDVVCKLLQLLMWFESDDGCWDNDVNAASIDLMADLEVWIRYDAARSGEVWSALRAIDKGRAAAVV